MSKVKVIAVLVLCGVVSSLDAVENYDIETGSNLSKLDEDVVGEVLQSTVHTFVDGGRYTERERRNAHKLARFLIEKGAADYDALHYLWDDFYATDVIYTNDERKELTLLMQNTGKLDINYVWPSCPPNAYATVRDMNRDVENDQFLEHIGAKKFNDLSQKEKDEAITRIANDRIPR
ncbi:hypothetical protein FACS1894122_14850 [Alphaproteobacteria bacterium]|nr:hypothetical protein FACS1894122_14850 [Alphaproteobacteria bacterium]